MKSIITLIFITLLGIAPVLLVAQTTAAVEKKVDVEWVETRHDFGEIVQSVPAIHTFEFTNNGENPVVILAAKASCGCTVPKYSKEPIRPGEKGTVEVKYDSKRMGNFSKSVRVTIDGMKRTTILFITGNVVNKTEEE